ncbi:MAG: hypothetical protein K8I65_08495 [Thermoanaerobaculia bacterium]|nr:hypothetical protein [Thermoanaerobaculia bacterium]
MPPSPRRSPALVAVASLALLGARSVSGAETARGGPPRLAHLETSHGLSHNSVYALHQDRRGWLWIGTVDGLDRFDGHEFRVERPRAGDAASPSSPVVRALAEDCDGSLWVATEAGLDHRSPGGAWRRHRPAGRAAVVHSVAVTDDCSVWSGGQGGLFRFDRAADRFLAVVPGRPGRADSVRALAPDPGRGALWAIAFDAAGLSTEIWQISTADARAERWALDPAWSTTWAAIVDPEGRLWLDPAAPVRFEPEHRRARRDGGPATPPVRAALRARDGALWFGTTDGAFVRRGDRVEALRPERERPTWLHNYVRSVLEDRDGSIWLGTYGGLYRHDPFRQPFELLGTAEGAEAPAAAPVSALAPGPGGAVWIASFGAGLRLFDLDRGLALGIERARPGVSGALPDDVVWCLLPDPDGGLWAGLESGLARREPDGRWSRQPLEGGAVESERVSTLARGPDATLWIGTEHGLHRLRPGAASAERVALPGGDRARVDSLLAESDHLRIGADGHRLVRIDAVTGTVTSRDLVSGGERSVSEGIWQILPAPPLGTWLATGYGLWLLGPDDEPRAHFTTANGLPGSVVYSAAPDGGAPDRLWLGTNRGLARCELAGERLACRGFDAADGLAEREFNRGAVLAAPDGRLLFGGLDGVTRFDPRRIRTRMTAPPVVAVGARFWGSEGFRQVDGEGLATLEVPAGSGAFAIEYAALLFSNPRRASYRYRLEGFDRDWVEAGHRREARYTRIPPGTYRFRVVAANEDGVWGTAGFTLPVRVLPAWWQRRPVQAAGLLAAVALLVGLHRLRMARAIEIERMRWRLAGDLHDELSTELASIAVAADLLAGRAGEGSAASDRLREIRDTALRAVDSVRDVVWSLSPDHDHGGALVERLRAECARLLAGLEVDFDARAVHPGVDVPMTARRAATLVFKEAAHNVVRHSGAGRARVTLAVDPATLELTLADDGRGFDAGRPAGGVGLASLARRAREAGGTLVCDSAPGSGTTVRLRIPLKVPGRFRLLPRTREGSAAGAKLSSRACRRHTPEREDS